MTHAKDEALKLALEALEMCEVPWTGTLDHNLTEAITAIKQALAAPVQPVAVVSGYYGGQCVVLPTDPARLFNSGTAFYTTPPAAQRQWVGLTPSEMDRCWNMTPMDTRNSRHMFAYAIEAKLKEKNNG